MQKRVDAAKSNPAEFDEWYNKGKICNECEILLTKDNWNTRFAAQYRYICIDCDHKAKKEHIVARKNNPEFMNEIYAANHTCLKCKTILTRENWTIAAASGGNRMCRICLNEYNRGKGAQIKKEVFDTYGGECVCCGENNYDCLGIDHVAEDGAEHRRNNKNFRGGGAFYRWLKANDYPKGNYQLLCSGCNFSKHFNEGKCSHSKNPNHALIKNIKSKINKLPAERLAQIMEAIRIISHS